MPECAQHLGGGLHAALVFDLAEANKREREVRQRGEVARGAHRTPFGDHRVRARVEQLEQALDDGDAHAGVPERERLRAQEHDAAHHLGGQGRAHPDRVRDDKVVLQLRKLRLVHADGGELAETGVDAVDRLLPRYDALDEAAGARQPCARGVREGDAFTAAHDGGEAFQVQGGV